MTHLCTLIFTIFKIYPRRAIASRERTIHSLRAERLDPHHFQLYLETQAGTYVKEFVHGDFGRTVPSLGNLLGAECDIMELDVDVRILFHFYLKILFFITFHIRDWAKYVVQIMSLKV